MRRCVSDLRVDRNYSLTGISSSRIATVFESEVSSNCKHFGSNAILIRLEFLLGRGREEASEDNYLRRRKEKEGKEEKREKDSENKSDEL